MAFRPIEDVEVISERPATRAAGRGFRPIEATEEPLPEALTPQIGAAVREMLATPEEIAIASRPVTGVTARGPRRFLEPRYEDDEFTPITAPWTGEGGVIPALPAAAVAAAHEAAANLRRMGARERIVQREPIVSAPVALAETPAGAVTGRAAPGSIERQARELEADRAALEAAEREAGIASEELKAATPRNMTTAQQALHSVATSAAPTLAGVTAGILTRNPYLAMAIAGGGGTAMEAGSTYGQALEKGASHRRASAAATIDGILEGVGEALPLSIALKPGTPIMARIFNTIQAEAGQEAATQIMQDLHAFLNFDPDMSLAQAWQNLKVAALAGGMAGSIYGTAGAAADAAAARQAPKETIDATQERIEPAGDRAEHPGADAFVSQDRIDRVLAPVEQPTSTAPGSGDRVQPGATVEAPVIERPVIEEPIRRGPPTDAEIDEAAASLKAEIGAVERGGRVLIDETTRDTVPGTGDVIGKTVWVGAPWWFQRPDPGLDAAAAKRAIDKWQEGKKLGAREQRFIDYLREEARRRMQAESAVGEDLPDALSDIQAEGLDATPVNVIDADLVAKAAAIDEVAVERAAIKYENDDAAFMAEVQRIVNEQGEAAPGSREENQGAATERSAVAPGTIQAGTEAQATTARRQVAARRGFRPLSSLGMPAASLAAQAPAGGAAVAVATPPAPTTQQTQQPSVSKAEARPDAIRKAVQELFETVVSEKHQGARNLGVYRVKPQTIRLRNRNDLRTLGHEVGHHISERNRPFRAIMRAHGAELMPMAPQAYQGKGHPKRFMVEEGFAEFIAEYLSDRPTARRKAPGFFADFEAWLNQNPRHKEAIARVSDMIGAHATLDPADRILAKVGSYQPPWKERVGEVVSRDTWDAFVQGVLDKWHPAKRMVEDLAPDLAESKNPYVAFRLLAGDAAIVEDWISNFTSPYDFQKRLDPKNFGASLKDILAPIVEQGEAVLNQFKAYLIARRAAELKKAGKENLFDVQEIIDGIKLGQANPSFKTVAKAVYDYNDRLLDYAVEGGLLSAEQAKAFRQYANYIPFFREAEGEAKPGGKGQPFKRLKGGTQNLRDPIANLIQNTSNIIHAVNRNAALKKAVELAVAVPGGGRWMETVPLPSQAHRLATQRIIDELTKQGVQVDASMAQNLAAMQTFWTKVGKGDERTRTLVYKDAGEFKAVQVNNLLLWKALSNIPPLEMGLIGKLLAFPARTLRSGVVLDPTFMARNFVRDTLSATIQSRGKFIPVASTAQGIKMMAQQTDAYRLWRAFGGAFSDQFRESEEAAQVIERMAKRGNFAPASIITPWRWLDILREVGAFTEAGSRIGEFAATYKPGDVDSALRAALNAREVSTDFGMRGGSEAIQVWTRITPFMNPAMQGIYKTARVLAGGDGKAAVMKAAVIGSAIALVSMTLALMNADEDWYRDLEDWEKATYWHFKVGDEIYRVIKPFEYGALFASAPEAIALLQQGKEHWKDFKRRMLQVLGNVLGFRAIPQAATIVVEPIANRSFFTGRPIVTDADKDLEPGLQANPSTSKTARAAGEALNYPPAMIDNHVRNTFGTVGVHIVTAADMLMEQSGISPQGRERTWRQWPVIKAFVHDPDNPNTKAMTEFYNDLKEYRRALKSLKEYERRGDEAGAERYREAKQTEIERAKQANKTAANIAKLRRAMEEIEASRDHTPAEKRERINELVRRTRMEVDTFRARTGEAR